MGGSVSWQDMLLTGLGSAFVASAAAVVVAYLTVRWTQRGHHEAEAQRVRREASDELQRGLIHYLRDVANGVDPTASLFAWVTEQGVYGPRLGDEDLRERCAKLAREWDRALTAGQVPPVDNTQVRSVLVDLQDVGLPRAGGSRRP